MSRQDRGNEASIGAGTRVRHRASDRPPAPGRWPALDGLRGIAVLAVMGIHVGILPGGYLGVDVFFVLSGFLITSLLIREWDSRDGRISFRDFYARRALRLLPALGCVLAAATLFALLLRSDGTQAQARLADSTLSAIPWVLAFAGNVAAELRHYSGSLGALSHTWSLAVEEQFYLIWPAVFVLIMRRSVRRERIALALAVLALAEMAYRIAAAADLGYGFHRYNFGADTHSDGLLLGCAIAFWLSSPARARDWPRWLVQAVTWLGAASLVVLFVAADKAGTPADISAGVLATGAVIVGVVCGSAPAAVSRVLCSRPMTQIGRQSYGLYLWHYLILYMALPFLTLTSGLSAQVRLLAFAVVLAGGTAATFLVASLSYRFVELPALRIKRRFEPATSAAVPAARPGEPDVQVPSRV